MQKISRLMVMTLLILGSVYAASAQDETAFSYPFAGVMDGQLQVFTGDTPALINMPPNRGIIDTDWSPDGSKLAVLYYDDSYQSRVLVADPAGGEPFPLETGSLEIGFPISFTPEGEILYAQQAGDPANPGADYRINLNTIAPEVGAQPETLGSVAHFVGCGGGSIIPADWLYGDETGFGGNYLSLEWTLYGILHSTSCAGGTAALFDPVTGEDRPLEAGQNEGSNVLGRLQLSPDGETLAGIRTIYQEPAPVHSLVLIALASGAVTEVATTEAPDQLAWGSDGTIFYSTRTAAGNLLENLPDEQKAALIDALSYDPGDIASYRVTVRQLNPITGDDVEIYTADAYAIGRMEASADGKYLFISQIANLDGWLNGLIDGTINLVDDVDGSQQRDAVPVTLMQIPLTTEDAPVAVGEWSQIALQPALL